MLLHQKLIVDGFISKCGSVLDAVLEERKLEFGGEGIRRYDLIRNNKLGMAIDNFHKRTSAMISDLNLKVIILLIMVILFHPIFGLKK